MTISQCITTVRNFFLNKWHQKRIHFVRHFVLTNLLGPFVAKTERLKHFPENILKHKVKTDINETNLMANGTLRARFSFCVLLRRDKIRCMLYTFLTNQIKKKDSQNRNNFFCLFFTRWIVIGEFSSGCLHWQKDELIKLDENRAQQHAIKY